MKDVTSRQYVQAGQPVYLFFSKKQRSDRIREGKRWIESRLVTEGTERVQKHVNKLQKSGQRSSTSTSNQVARFEVRHMTWTQQKDNKMQTEEEEEFCSSSATTHVPSTLSFLRLPDFASIIMPDFFLLLAAKVRSSCEEGPGQSALQSAYHNPKLDVHILKQNETS